MWARPHTMSIVKGAALAKRQRKTDTFFAPCGHKESYMCTMHPSSKKANECKTRTRISPRMGQSVRTTVPTLSHDVNPANANPALDQGEHGWAQKYPAGMETFAGEFSGASRH